jgi:hypothetical protein
MVRGEIAEFNAYYERFPSEAVRFVREAKKTVSVVARRKGGRR